MRGRRGRAPRATFSNDSIDLVSQHWQRSRVGCGSQRNEGDISLCHSGCDIDEALLMPAGVAAEGLARCIHVGLKRACQIARLSYATRTCQR